jgi:hypothetical protein
MDDDDEGWVIVKAGSNTFATAYRAARATYAVYRIATTVARVVVVAETVARFAAMVR